MQLSHCTLTGVDEATDLGRLAELSAEFPLAEWGFLFSPKHQGQPGRFPAVATMRRAFQELPASVRVALHVCGQGVPDLLAGEAVVTQLAALVGARQGRVQLNFNQRRNPQDMDSLEAWLAKHDGVTVITQHNSANARVHEMLREHGNHAVLFDASGGQGISPDIWPEPLRGTSCGFAGGLGPDNLRQELDRIAEVAPTRITWVDMEGKLRTPDPAGVADWFDLGRCEACLSEANAWAAANVGAGSARIP